MARKHVPELDGEAGKLVFRPETRSIDYLVSLFERKRLKLSPGFQRKSVWNRRDRENLIDSILRNYPLPSIFLYERADERSGSTVYDVVDGKQRLETVLMFMAKMGLKHRFDIPFENEDGRRVRLSWRELLRQRKQSLLENYKLTTIEVSGDLNEIISLFVRINSTGKALTGAEKRNARYSTSPFLKTANRLARRYEKYLRELRVVNENQASRMKHVELMCELLLAAMTEDVTDQKAALDKVMSSEKQNSTLLRKAEKATTRSLRDIKRMFPKLRETRLRQMSDFYSLVVLLQRYVREGVILTNRQRNSQAWSKLSQFAARVDEVAASQKRGKRVSAGHSIYRDYHATVSRATDRREQRVLRQEILDKLIRPELTEKDRRRSFSQEERRILWERARDKTCKDCGKPLKFSTFTVDHVKPHSKGGKTKLSNAALLCRSCNSAKGNR